MTSVPTRVYGKTGVVVPDTELINKALAYARERLNDMAYNHVVRSWLFGFVIAGKIPELKDRDLEVHSISAILHDLGWDTTGELVSKDKRFEVDGANAARDFLKSEAVGDKWDFRRLQLVWDAIALHTTPSIASYKEPEVVATTNGIGSDFGGPKGPFGQFLTEEEYQKIVDELPRLGLKEGIREIMCGLCRNKPETTSAAVPTPMASNNEQPIITPESLIASAKGSSMSGKQMRHVSDELAEHSKGLDEKALKDWFIIHTAGMEARADARAKKLEEKFSKKLDQFSEKFTERFDKMSEEFKEVKDKIKSNNSKYD